MQNTYIDEKFCKELLEKFIKVNTCQPLGNEGDMVKALLEVFPKDTPKLILNHGENRQTLILKINGEQRTGGIALIGHIDTVACGDESKWKYPPLKANYEDGYIYGRGAADMKGGVVVMVATALTLLASNKRPKGDIYFCFTADEEKGGLGAVELSKLEELNNVEEIFITEPSNEKIGISEKGALWLKVRTIGTQAHGSRPEVGINSIEKSLELYEEFKKCLDFNTKDKYLGYVTSAITKISGGTMTNIIPAYAEMEIDIRTLTNVNHEELINSFKSIAKDMEKDGLSYEIEVLNNRPAAGVTEDSIIVKKVCNILNKLHMSTEKKGIFFYTDASQIIPKNEKPFVIFGPGDDLLAHQTDERIEVKSMVRVANFYVNYIKEYYY